MEPVYQHQCPTDPADLAAIAEAVRWRAALERALGGSLTGTLVGRRAYNALDWGLPQLDAIKHVLLAQLARHAGAGPWCMTA